MTRRAAIAALVAFAAVGARDAHAEWVTEVVTNRVEYDGVEYLESSGTQYIDTGYYIQITDTIEIEVYANSPVYGVAIGARKSVTPNLDGIAIWASMNGSQYNRFDLFFCDKTTAQPTFVTLGDKHKYTKCGVINKIDGVEIESNGGNVDYTPRYPAYIFAMNHAGEARFMATMRLYMCKISRVLDLIPILDNGTPKMLDLVSGETFANSGTGAFTYGAVTGKVAYVTITTNRVYRAPAPMRSYDAQHPFNAPTARTRLGGTGSGEDGTTLRPTAHIAIKRNEED